MNTPTDADRRAVYLAAYAALTVSYLDKPPGRVLIADAAKQIADGLPGIPHEFGGRTTKGIP
jgi:hypothetical protein